MTLWERKLRLYFDHTPQWYMHNPESVQENKTHEILSDYKIKRDHLFPKWTSDFNKQTKKRTYSQVDFAVPANYRLKI